MLEEIDTFTVTSEDMNPKRKQYELKTKKYHLEIKRIKYDNFVVGDFCTFKQISDALNDLRFFPFHITQFMAYNHSKIKALSTIIITKYNSFE